MNAAAMSAASQPLSPLTQAGVVMGTPLYMSPEQHMGNAADSRSDQFSFCVALYEALYQKLPFAGNTIEALAFNTVSGRVQPRPSGTHVPMAVHEALLRGLSPAPEQRFPSMRELITALNFDPTMDPSAAPRARRRVTIYMILFSIIAALGPTVLHALGVSEMVASTAIALAFFLVFTILSVRFRRMFKNAFHRGMLTYGLVFGGQVLLLRAVGMLLGLSHLQIATIDLVAIAATTCMTAALVLPTMWPMVPPAIITSLIAAARPAYAPVIASVVIPITTITGLLLWNRVAAVRRPRTRSTSSTAIPILGSSSSTGEQLTPTRKT